MNRKIQKMQKKLKSHLDKERYEHTLGVMYTAAAMAMCHGEDMEKALTAGLLHDCAKCIPGDKKLRLCGRYHLSISEAEASNPSLLHAKLGAYLAAKKYHVRDRDILNSIASHTTGRPICPPWRRSSILRIIWNREGTNFPIWRRCAGWHFMTWTAVFTGS